MQNHRSFLLYPLSLAYGFLTGFRNMLYDSGTFASYEFRVPVICLGNITVGGTGKTPHTEYLIRLLKDEFKVAVLSRGYKRKTSGFITASAGSAVYDIGDEPLQIFRKFPDITVAVDRDRVHGVKTILRNFPGTDVVILDDGFQHRKIKPGLNILLCDCNHPMHKDHILPFGNLRESVKNVRRADIIIVTKTPAGIPEEQRKIIEKETGAEPHQHLFFTKIKYEPPVPVYDLKPVQEFPSGKNEKASSGIVVITAIADPEPFLKFLRESFGEIIHLTFPDHHKFMPKDIQNIITAFNNLKNPQKYIITTEKDAVRLAETKGLPEEIRRSAFYIPVSIDFLDDGKKMFDKLIKDYVGKNK